MLLLIPLLACKGDAAEPAVEAAPPSRRIVAVGDLHGDLEAALAVLQLAGVVDAEGAWSGGDALLVQTGDTTDRGPRSKGVMDLVMRLEAEAPKAGGEVIALRGNHEVMNLVGDWRYVSPEDVDEFGGMEPRKAALSPDGVYGAWLASLDYVAVVDRIVFVHGGVTPEFAAMGLDALNALGPDQLGESSPIWYRGYLQDPEPEACKVLSEALVALAAERMVVGHTTQRSGEIASRCKGRILGIDVGISAHYGRNLAAVEFVDGDARALYPTAPVDLPDP